MKASTWTSTESTSHESHKTRQNVSLFLTADLSGGPILTIARILFYWMWYFSGVASHLDTRVHIVAYPVWHLFFSFPAHSPMGRSYSAQHCWRYGLESYIRLDSAAGDGHWCWTKPPSRRLPAEIGRKEWSKKQIGFILKKNPYR